MSPLSRRFQLKAIGSERSVQSRQPTAGSYFFPLPTAATGFGHAFFATEAYIPGISV
jgi:hypothetical protein